MAYAFLTILVPFEDGAEPPTPEEAMKDPRARFFGELFPSIEDDQAIMDAARAAGRAHCRAIQEEKVADAG